MSFRRRLIAARKKAGLTQRQLAELVGVAHSTVAGWETDATWAHETSMARLRLIASALHVDISELMA